MWHPNPSYYHTVKTTSILWLYNTASGYILPLSEDQNYISCMSDFEIACFIAAHNIITSQAKYKKVLGWTPRNELVHTFIDFAQNMEYKLSFSIYKHITY